ncbi:MAG TPA: DNA polymerase III subunit gamma/tau [Rubrobacteraceae bacterium]|nr:DNA polymerase III subunit gamma/tau [Rubrobacteraceae bacterium]
MRHATLYRKWRPRAFSEISGQEPVVRTLRRAIETDRVAHAYLFSGPRGTGKTSTAKVLAMGLNCVQGPTPEPDGTCENCRAIINNSSMDVLEMDAASNRGIDEIRELRDRVNLAPAAGRMKVYIIDEVHMLTTEAFNALLKMLEEPPEHVIFVLATTEKHKVLPTIISRCQSFDFRRPGVGTLSEKLAEIAEAEGIEAETETLTIIAREGKGSFRDAEGLLDQLSSFAEGPITATMVRELLGSVGSDVLLETTAALHERRAADALKIVDRLSNEGRDLGQFVSELLGHLRRVMLLPHATDIALADVGADERAPLEEQAANVPTAEVVRLVETLGDAAGRIKRDGDPKLELELTFLRLARDYTEPDVDNLLRRLEALEAAVENGVTVATSPASIQSETDALSEREEKSEAMKGSQAPEQGEEAPGEPEPTGKPVGAVSAESLAARWPALIQDMKDRRQAPAAAVFEEARVEDFSDGVLEIAFPKELAIYAKLASDPRHTEALQEALERNLGIKPRLESRVGDGQAGAEEKPAPLNAEPFEEPEQASQSAKSSDMQGAPSQPEPEKGKGSAAEPPETSELPEDRGTTETGGGDDTIRSEQEAFALAREWFGSSNKNGGS